MGEMQIDAAAIWEFHMQTDSVTQAQHKGF